MVASTAHAQSVQLRWDPPVGSPIVSYIVERGTSPGVYTTSATVAQGVTRYEATGLVRGVRYYFVVRAIDVAGLRSGPSNEISVLLPEIAPPPPPPPPPAPPTTTVTSEPALQQAVGTLVTNAAIVLAPGTYRLTRPLVLAGTWQDVTVRSSTGRASDVVVIAPPGTSTAPPPAAIVVQGSTRLTLSGITVQTTTGIGVQFGEGVQQPRLTGVRFVGAGRFVQALRHASGSGSTGGIVDGCTFEYVGTAQALPSGLDLRGVRSWIVRGNRFVDTAPSATNLFGPVVHAWQGSTGTLVERNTFVHTAREIVFGLGNTTPDQHTGGTIRNNMIVRRPSTGVRGAAISLLDAPEATVVHNSILVSGTAPAAIEYAHVDTQRVVIANNLTDRPIQARDAAQATLMQNVTSATAWWFVDALRGDLRLNAAMMRMDGSSTVGPLVIDAAWPVASATHDHEGQARPAGAAADIGADEHR